MTDTHNNNSEKQANSDTSEHIAPVMLVVGDTGHERVPREKHQDELDPVADQLGTAPGKALLEIHLLEQGFEVICNDHSNIMQYVIIFLPKPHVTQNRRNTIRSSILSC